MNQVFLMKRHAQYHDRLTTGIISIISLICFLVLLATPSAIGSDSIADEIISIDVKEKPLGEVLEDISQAIGYQFSIHDSWEDFPITATIKNEPLHKGLKKILRKLNNAVIYGSEGIIKVMIYGEISPSETPDRRLNSEGLSGEAIDQPVSYRRTLDSESDEPLSEHTRDEETDESAVQDDYPSDSETAEIGADKDEEEEEGEKEDIGISETLESQKDESAAEKNSVQTEETESAASESENFGDKESAEETSTN